MPILKEFRYLSNDKRTELYARGFLPDGEMKGIVQIVHGVAEYSNRYDEFMKFLAEKGYGAFADDHLGHGQSVKEEEDRGFFAESDGWNIVVKDLKSLHEKIKEEYPDKPMFLLGHSMGSFLSRTYIIDYPNDHKGVILSGTGQQSGLIVSVGKILAEKECKKHGARYQSQKLQKTAFGSYNKLFKPQRTEFDWLSRNEENVDAYIADPLCGAVSSAGLFRDMMGGLKYISKLTNLMQMNKKMPVLFISGKLDPVGDYGKGVLNAAFKFKTAGMKDVKVELYEDDRHEILNEVDKEKVYKDVINWIEEHNK